MATEMRSRPLNVIPVITITLVLGLSIGLARVPSPQIVVIVIGYLVGVVPPLLLALIGSASTTPRQRHLYVTYAASTALSLVLMLIAVVPAPAGPEFKILILLTTMAGIGASGMALRASNLAK